MSRRAIIFDFNWTLYDPKSQSLFPDVRELLEEVSLSRRLILYSKLEGGRDSLIEDLDILKYFESTHFVEHKTAEGILNILADHELKAAETIIVGDLMTSELAAGHGAGLDTVWLRHSKFADEVGDFEPTHTVRSIIELRGLLKQIN